MLSQIIAVTGVNIRSIPARLGSSTVAVIGIAGVVLVFVAVLSIAEGVNATMKASGDPNLVLILRAGSDTEMTSGVPGDSVRVIQDAPGIARDESGAPLTSPELFVVVDHPLKRSGSPANVPLRGVSPEAFKVHNRLKIVEGRNLEFGKNEIIAGRAAASQFLNLTVGTTLKWGEGTWQLVGIFDDGGSVSESELWCDVKVLQPAYRRGNSYQSVYARLASPDAFHPLAFTPVCANQMRGYESDLAQFEKAEAAVLGISIDAQPAKAAWAKTLDSISYDLLSDFHPHGEVAQKYGVFRQQEGFSERAVFLVDKNGRIAWSKAYAIPELPKNDEIFAALQHLA